MSLWNDLNDYTKYPEIPELPNPEQIPDFCTSSKGLRQFLIHSRNLSDDVLRQRINSIVINNEQLKNGKYEKEEICKEFIEKILIKSWNERLKGLQFCNVELNSLEKKIHDINNSKINKEGIDLRFDPYAIRDLENEKEEKLLKFNNLKNFLNNESKIESIIQEKSKEVIFDYCGVSELINLKFKK